MAESEEELKSLLMRVKDKTGRADFKLNIKKKKKKKEIRRFQRAIKKGSATATFCYRRAMRF